MPFLSPKTTKQIEKESADRRNAAHLFKQFKNEAFSLDNNEHLEFLQAAIANFELELHKLRLLQVVIPCVALGNFFNSWSFTMGAVVSLGLLAYHQKNLQTFNDGSLKEMVAIYNWALKNNQSSYDEKTNNDHKLCNPDIQKMIELLAGVVEPEFLRVWPKSKGLLEQTCAFFNPNINDDKLERFKKSVESGEMCVNAWEGIKKSGQYFLGNPKASSYQCIENFGLLQKWYRDIKEVGSVYTSTKHRQDAANVL